MDSKIPKKRGRKPKIKVDYSENKESIFENKTVEKKIISSTSSLKNNELSNNILNNIKIIVEDNKKKIKKYDNIMLSDNFIDGISNKFLSSRYIENNNNIIIKQMINKINNKNLNDFETNNWIKILYDAAEKLSKIIDYYLSSGPLTKNEVHLLDRSIYLLKSYYILQTKDIIKQNIPNDLVKKILYMPDTTTYTYKVFIGQMPELPFKTRIFKN